jgi:hypothetical protein
VGSSDDLPKIFDVDFGVKRRRLNEAMAEELLHVADAGTSSKQVRRAGMTKTVRGNGMRNAGRAAVVSHHGVDQASADSLSGSR